MVNATINGIDITVEDGTTILAAARKVGVDVPTLCYLKEVNEIGACRVCVVEVEGQDRCVTACNNVTVHYSRSPMSLIYQKCHMTQYLKRISGIRIFHL